MGKGVYLMGPRLFWVGLISYLVEVFLISFHIFLEDILCTVRKHLPFLPVIYVSLHRFFSEFWSHFWLAPILINGGTHVLFHIQILQVALLSDNNPVNTGIIQSWLFPNIPNSSLLVLWRIGASRILSRRSRTPPQIEELLLETILDNACSK